jgi:hypothetical protein
MTLSKLFDLLAVRENGVHPGEGEFFIPMIDTWFLFCLIWSVGASVDEAGRNTFDIWLRDQDPRLAFFLSNQYFMSFKYSIASTTCCRIIISTQNLTLVMKSAWVIESAEYLDSWCFSIKK